MILVTGATGYVGGRLVPALLDGGHTLRCLTRRPDYLRSRVAAEVEIVHGDVADPAVLEEAMAGVSTAYYLVHSMGGSEDFAEYDRQAARRFAAAAARAGVGKIIYLGGLGSDNGISKHLASRQEVGRILRSSPVPTIEFRASIIIGSGSISFEMVRGLVEKLPVMTTPRWVRSLAQPVAIRDVVDYLLQAGEMAISESRLYEIGGADRLSFSGIMKAYASARGLRRFIVPVPVLTPRLSGVWLALVTPLYYRVGRWLIDGIRSDSIADDTAARRDFDITPLGIDAAIRQAMSAEDAVFAATRWSDALLPHDVSTVSGGRRIGSRVVYSVATRMPVRRHDAFLPIQYIGGHRGWYSHRWLWTLRSFLDKLTGGVGGNRGRRDPIILLPGDVVDFWRVEELVQYETLRLRAEMRLPGRGWLQFDVDETADGSETEVRITAIFEPRGMRGLVYWYALYPVHRIIFSRMLSEIRSAALHAV